MKTCVFFLLTFFSLFTFAAPATELDLMPYPKQLTLQSGYLKLDKSFHVVIDGADSPLLRKELERFVTRLQKQTGLTVVSPAIRKADAKKITAPVLRVVVANIPETENGYALERDETYRLEVNSAQVNLTANTRTGAVRGLETLLQLIGVQKKTVRVPHMVIEDAPRFVWRGVLLDSSRHFLSIDTLKRQLDALAAAKYNIFHWHLTDDQGWRMESNAFPKLHELASDGEYYSQQDIREIVAYAQQRGIHVLPEIDIPGHASAIALAYPALMSAPGPYEKEIRWGVHKPTLDPTNEKVYEFVDKLMAEISTLFPFEYVHIGGDEVDPEHWNNNADIQAFMKKNALADHRALQAWFNRRVVKILEKHQRKMIGWDEIQHPDLPKNIAIQSWQGPDAVSDAISHGFQAILSTGYYLDQPQPAAYHYRNDPVPVMESINDQVRAGETWQTWSFEIPRKRGSAIKGTFTLIENEDDQRGFIDFAGKSRRALHAMKNIHGETHFHLDTWMGVFAPRITLNNGQLQGDVIVGNTPYTISGKQIAGSTMPGTQMPSAIHQPALTDAARELVLGGEAALWAELVDDTVIDLRLWPRAFAVGERLWSPLALQDDGSMYRRMQRVSDLAVVSINLQHHQQARDGMSKFVSKPQDIKPLEIFSQAIEQAQYYHRHHEKHVYGTYSKADPLNFFVDTLPAESLAVRELDQLVDNFLENPRDKKVRQQLLALLKTWEKNHQPLMQVIERNPRLADIKPLAQRVDQVTQLGLKLVEQLVREKPLPVGQVEPARKLLRDAQQMHQEIVVSAAYPIEKLLNAAY
ncbi:beta-N-acetylhexosaminidase [Cellvibrio sp. ARAG 10.3]|uniref:beta-N-acetylhexosaminidase n=1 Tax=Cellvibrio sp. ARAG 10.3 TaxID=3451358 RepID=UPI003F451D1C